MKTGRHGAVLLAAGKGTRMGSSVPKQFMELDGKPLLYYSLMALQKSFIDEIVLVTSPEAVEYCRKELVEAYGCTKVTRIVPGGKERYDSVYAGLCALEHTDYVYIHDGARPFLNPEILEEARKTVLQFHACAAGMPVKDTIKLVDDKDMVTETPDRSRVWQIQTPQVFEYSLIKEAYDRLFATKATAGVTDDAMVVEAMTGHPVKLFRASYENIKITTPEDLKIAETLRRE